MFTTTNSTSQLYIQPSNFGTENVKVRQTKVAVFKVTRDEWGNINSTKFVDEFWIERKNGASIDYEVANLLEEKLPADQIIIREIFSLTF